MFDDTDHVVCDNFSYAGEKPENVNEKMLICSRCGWEKGLHDIVVCGNV